MNLKFNVLLLIVTSSNPIITVDLKMQRSHNQKVTKTSYLKILFTIDYRLKNIIIYKYAVLKGPFATFNVLFNVITYEYIKSCLAC